MAAGDSIDNFKRDMDKLSRQENAIRGARLSARIQLVLLEAMELELPLAVVIGMVTEIHKQLQANVQATIRAALAAAEAPGRSER